MLITYAIILGSKIAIRDQRRIIPSIHSAGLGFKEAKKHGAQPTALGSQLGVPF
jgi:hypothetical protein